MSIGLRIKQQRNILKISQPALALRLGMSLDSIKKLETDRVKPSIETLEKLSVIFNCSTDYLLGIETEIVGMKKEIIEIIKNMPEDRVKDFIDIIQKIIKE